MTKFFTLYDRPETKGLTCPEASLAEQVYKDQCDLNFLIKKYHLEDDPSQLSMLVDPSTRQMQFLDTSKVPDIYTALRDHQRISLIFSGLDYKTQAQFNFSVDSFAQYVLTAPVEDVKKLKIPGLEFKELIPAPEPLQPDKPVADSPSAPESQE